MSNQSHEQWKKDEYAQHYNTLYAPSVKEILAYLKPLHLNPKDVFVDFGCGTGDILFHASEIVKKAIGIDISESQLEQARKKLDKRENVELVQSPFLAWDPGALKITKASARKSLHHLTDNEKKEFISKIARHFKKNALFIIEDAIFSFDRSELESRMPEVLKEAEVYYGPRWGAVKEDVRITLLEEFPAGVNLWKEAFKAGGFTIIEETHITCFYARIVARKD